MKWTMASTNLNEMLFPFDINGSDKSFPFIFSVSKECLDVIHMNHEYKDAIKIAPLLSAIEIASSTLHLSAIKIAPP
jgi:hypothetical protein